MTDARTEAEVELNRAVAAMLLDFGPSRILDAIHWTTVLGAICEKEGDIEASEHAKGVRCDLEGLHQAALLYESDPEIIKRNWIAMLFNALSPFIVSIEEYLSGEDRPPWQLGVTGSVIFTEAMGAMQYLESVQINTNVHFESELVKLQQRAYEISIAHAKSAEDIASSSAVVRKFFDDIRAQNMEPSKKPPMLLILHLIIFIVSYKLFRSDFSIGMEPE